MQYDFIFKGMGNVEAIHTELKMDLLMEFGIFGIMVDMNQLDIWATYILRSNGYIVIVFTKNGIKNI